MLSDEQRQKALALVELGVTEDVALRSIGVIGDELRAALEDPSFQAETEVSTARFEVTALQAIRTGSPSEKRNMSWLLAARFPERYPTPGSRTSSRPSVPAVSSPAEGSAAVERMEARRARRRQEMEDAKLEEGMSAVERMYFRRARRLKEKEEARERNIQRLQASPAPQSTPARRQGVPDGVIGSDVSE